MLADFGEILASQDRKPQPPRPRLMSHPAAHSLKFDSAVEEFERNWDVLSIELIPHVVDSAAAGDTELLTELVRVDIDRRYHGGYEVQLSEYLKRFPQLRDHSPAVRVICFEDYRCRRRSGLPCTPHRWAEFTSIRQESWFLQLMDGNSHHDSVARPVSASSTVRPQGQAGTPAWQPSEASAAGLYRIDDFELVALLGKGAFSHVYLARQISLGGRYVAVKVVDRPLHEPNHLARLQHTGIIPLYSYHRANGRWILCMPYGGAATLADWIASSLLRESRTGQSLIDTVRKSQHRITTRLDNSDAPPEEREIRDSLKHSLASWHAATEKSLGTLSSMPAGQLTLWLFGKLSVALAHAHQRNIVHGDLKPGNILIRNDGEPALIDFNLSQQTSRGPEFLVGGTLPYMSPEHLTSLLKRSAVALWPTSDVFSLGVIMYELIEGRLPFTPAASVADSDLTQAIANLSSAPEFKQRGVPAGLKSIITKCLMPSATDRYRSAVELNEDVEREAAHRPLKHAHDPWIASRIPKLVRRFPKAFSAASLTVFFGVILMMLGYTLKQYKIRSSRLYAVESFQKFESQTNQIFADFLATDGPQSLLRRPLVQDSLQTLRGPVNGKLDDSLLTPEELQSATERLLAVAFIETLAKAAGPQTLGEAAAERSSESPYQQLLGCLPTWAESTAIAQAISRTDTSGSRFPPVSADVGTMSRPVDRVLIAVQYLLDNRPDLSLSILNNTQPPDSLRIIYWMTRGRAQLDLQQFSEAAASFSMVLRDAPLEAAYIHRGIAYLQQGAIQEALQDFTSAVNLAPESIPALLNRHIVHYQLGKMDAALEDLNRAVTLQPASNRLLMNRSNFQRMMGRTEAAQADYELAMKSPPASADDWVVVALARLPQAPQQALLDLTTAANQFGENATILFSLAHVYSEHLHRPEDAVAALNRMIERFPNSQKALSDRSVLHARAGHLDLALRDIHTLESQTTPLSGEASYKIGCAYALCSGNDPMLRQPALQMLAQAIRLRYGGNLLADDPDLARVRDTEEFRAIQQTDRLLSLPMSR